MNIRPLEALSREELIELIRHERMQVEAIGAGGVSGQSMTESNFTSAYRCQIIEADFETSIVTLKMHGKFHVGAGDRYLCEQGVRHER